MKCQPFSIQISQDVFLVSVLTDHFNDRFEGAAGQGACRVFVNKASPAEAIYSLGLGLGLSKANGSADGSCCLVLVTYGV